MSADITRHEYQPTPTGRCADCAAEVSKAANAGAELVLFTTMFDQAEQAERLAAEVIPLVA